MLEISTAASNLALLTQAELRAAIDHEDASEDAKLSVLGEYAASLITAACRVVPGATTQATLLAETGTETTEVDRSLRFLHLSRRPIISITSVVENTTDLTTDDYRIHKVKGALERRSGSTWSTWESGVDIIVVYRAGLTTIHPTLKFVAKRLILAFWQEGTRDRLLKRKHTEGVSEYEWWVEPLQDFVMPPDLMDALSRDGFLNEMMV